VFKVKKTSVRRTKRTDAIIYVRQTYAGDAHEGPQVYNRAVAGALRQIADALEKTKNAWADPQVTVWMHRPGEITAEITLAPMK
jgi:hypothetical protein